MTHGRHVAKFTACARLSVEMPPTMLLLLALISPIFAATCDNSRWNDADRQSIAKIHNDLRSKIARGDYWIKETRKGPASDMLEMEYDCELEKSAQRAVDICPASEGFGENLYWGYPDERLNLVEQVIKAVNNWEQELKHYKSTSSHSGHTAQMIWSRTSKVGCGLKECPMRRLMTVCHYSPAGNVKSQEVYKSGPMCSACPYGTACNRTTGLCTTRQNPTDVYQYEGQPATTKKNELEKELNRILDTVQRRVNCRKGQGIGLEWDDQRFRFRCGEDRRPHFIGCIATDGSVIPGGMSKTVGGSETKCTKHSNGTMTMDTVQKQRGSYQSLRITQNEDKWTYNPRPVMDGKNTATVIGRNVLEQPTTRNKTILNTPVDFELSEQCGQPLYLGYNGTCNQRGGIMWYMDKETLTCLAFKYTGCGGNRNRFTTKEECQRTCLPSDFQSCPANSQPVRRADNTSHCNPNGASRLDCPVAAVCKMGYGAGLCCDAEISRRVDANYSPFCGSGKKVYKSFQFGTKLIHLGKSCSHNFCPSMATCHQGEYFAYCCQ